MNSDAISQELKERSQWFCWRGEPDPKNPAKLIKRPVSPHTGRVADAHDPSNWASFQTALQRWEASNGRLSGIGFVLTEADPFVGIDLDDCIDEEGNIAPWADAIVKRLNSYTEITPSGRGLRIFVKGKLPPGGRRKGSIEMYDSKRFLTVTGDCL